MARLPRRRLLGDDAEVTSVWVTTVPVRRPRLPWTWNQRAPAPAVGQRAVDRDLRPFTARELPQCVHQEAGRVVVAEAQGDWSSCHRSARGGVCRHSPPPSRPRLAIRTVPSGSRSTVGDGSASSIAFMRSTSASPMPRRRTTRGALRAPTAVARHPPTRVAPTPARVLFLAASAGVAGELRTGIVLSAPRESWSRQARWPGLLGDPAQVSRVAAHQRQRDHTGDVVGLPRPPRATISGTRTGGCTAPPGPPSRPGSRRSSGRSTGSRRGGARTRPAAPLRACG